MFFLNNSNIVEVKLTDMLKDYELKTLELLLEMNNLSIIAFEVVSNAYYEVLGAKKLPRGVHVMPADKLSEVTIRVMLIS